MDQWDDVRGQWLEGLAPVPERLIGPLVTARTRAFLTMVGLPTSCAMQTLTFYHDERLLTPLERGGERYLIIGDDYEAIRFVLPAGRDEVYEIYPAAEGPSHFVNSTLPDFMYSLGLFCRHIPDLRTASDRELKLLVRRLRRALTARDERAFADQWRWWPRLLEQVLERFV